MNSDGKTEQTAFTKKIHCWGISALKIHTYAGGRPHQTLSWKQINKKKNPIHSEHLHRISAFPAIGYQKSFICRK